jgi:hypothetical protein
MAIFLSICIGIGFLSSCATRVYVRERPVEVVYERPPAPSREHIWITGDWLWVGGHYQWHEGHWERRREGYAWEGGHWAPVSGGWKWVPGRWRSA